MHTTKYRRQRSEGKRLKVQKCAKKEDGVRKKSKYRNMKTEEGSFNNEDRTTKMKEKRQRAGGRRHVTEGERVQPK